MRMKRLKRRQRFAMSVSGAWRITFQVSESPESGIEILDYSNYH